MKLLYPVSRSAMAFTFSVEKMFRMWPKIYFWTLTFRDFASDERAMYRFNQFATELKHKHPMCKGLRVVEVHPGAGLWKLSHGLHFHLLFTERICVHWLRRMSSKWGFGRVDVRVVSKDEAMYLAKYLTKGQSELKKGMRRWEGFGGWEYTRIRDVEIDSPFHRNIRYVQEELNVCKLSMDIIHSIYLNTKRYGLAEEWPVNKIYYSSKSKELLARLLPRGNIPTLSLAKVERNEDIVKRVRAVKWAKQSYHIRNRREPAAGEKKFWSPPPGSPLSIPGAAPVSKWDYVLNISGYDWDKLKAKHGGTLPAIRKYE